MISLFLDTSSKKLTIYLLKDNTILYEKVLETKNDHATYFVSLIDEALKENSMETKDIDKIYVVNGPGSFTGTRIGVTVGKTISEGLVEFKTRADGKINKITPQEAIEQCQKILLN